MKFLKEDSVSQKITFGILWTLFGTILSRAFNLIAFLLLARLLSIEDYGRFGLIRSFVLTMTTLGIASFGITATRFIAKYLNKDKNRVERIISLSRKVVLYFSTFILFFLLLFANKIAEIYFNDIELSNDIRISSIAIFFMSLNGLQLGILSGLERFKEISIINIFNGIIFLPLILILGYYYGLTGAVISLVINSFFIWQMSFFYTKRAIKENDINYISVKIHQEKKAVLNFTIPSFLSGLMLSPIIMIANIILANSPDGYFELGIYNAAYNYSIISITIVISIGQVLYPYAIKLSGENKIFDFFNINLPWFIGIIINVPLILFSDILGFTFGKEYLDTNISNVIAVVILFTLIIIYRQAIARNYAVKDLMWLAVIDNAIWGILAIFFSYYLVEYGAIGRAYSFLLAYIINSIILFPIFIKKGLIHKNLILVKENLFVIILILILFYLTFYDLNIISKIFLVIFSNVIIAFVFLNWFKNYKLKA